jgi:hypothetical protein
MFMMYAGLGAIKFFLALALSKKVELDQKKQKKSIMSILPPISPESKVIVFNLCLLFALDAFASSLVSL